MGKIECIEPASVRIVKAELIKPVFTKQEEAYKNQRVIELPIVRQIGGTNVAIYGIEGLTAAYVLGQQSPVYIPQNRRDFVTLQMIRPFFLPDVDNLDEIASRMNTTINYGFENAVERAFGVACASGIVDIESLAEHRLKKLVPQ